MNKQVLVPLAEGFEEIEAVTIIDILRRADVDVVTCYLDRQLVEGAHRVSIKADVSIDEIKVHDLAAIVLPGGMPGSQTLADDVRVIELVKKVAQQGGITAAICAAPIALAKAGVLTGRRATAYPGFGEKLKGANVEALPVIVDGRVVTGQGPGSAASFALKLVEILRSKDKSDELRSGMLWS